tara:strand:- start:16810 stop:17046 length:237 start_codon:yes stop_codon:yes gene_type:complete
MDIFFVLVVSVVTMPTDFKYIGHFTSCDQADLYMELHIPDKVESRCLLEDYIYLPTDIKKRVITIHDESKGFLSDGMY